MENASDALIMAGQVLIFIIALTVCISSFTTLRVGIDSTIEQTETIKFAKDSDLYINFIKSRNDGSTRIVGAETVVSSMYRAIKEDFTMYLDLKDGTFNEVHSTLSDKIDVRNEDGDIIGSYKIVYDTNNKWIKITIANDANYRSNALLKNGLYDIIKGKSFNEYLGEYQEETNEGVSSENKQTKRIITYEEIDI